MEINSIYELSEANQKINDLEELDQYQTLTDEQLEELEELYSSVNYFIRQN